MRAERRLVRTCAGLALAGCLAGVRPARAQDLFGSLQVQYQRTDLTQLRLAPDGSVVTTKRASELWLQTYEANHRAYPGPNMLLQTTLRFVGQADAHGPNSVQSPQGSMRLLHPLFQVLAFYQPVYTHSEFRTPVGTGDSTVATRLDSRYSQTHLVGRLSPVNLPQLDLDWIRRFRDDTGFAAREHSDQQTARLSYARPWWNAYAGVTHQHSEREGVAIVPLDQRVASAGGAMRLSPGRNAGIGISYDLADTRSAVGGQSTAITTSQVGNLIGNWRFAPRWSADVNWILHRMTTNQIQSGLQQDQDLTALATWLPRRRVRVTGGGGERTVHLTRGGDDLLEYLTATAAADGMARRDWQLTGSLTTTTNWDPERGHYSVQTLGFTSRMEARRRAQLDIAWQLTANGDTALTSQAATINWGARLDLTPLRSLTVTGALRAARTGPGLVVVSSVTRTRSLSFSWHPTPAATLVGSYSSTGLLPDDSPRNSTRSLTAQYAPSPRLQFTGVWSKSTQVSAIPVAGGLAGSEIVSGRLQSALTNRLTAAAGASVSDRGQPQSSKQYDATMTWSFGR